MAITELTLRRAAELRDMVDDYVDASTRALTARWAQAWQEIAAEWQDTITVILARKAAGDQLTPAQITQLARTQRALAMTSARLRELAAEIGPLLEPAVREVVERTADLTTGVAMSQMPPVDSKLLPSFTRVDQSALEQIIERTLGQIHASSLPLTDEAVDAMTSALIRAVPSGWHPDRAAREMLRRTRGGFNGGLTRALTLARTEMLTAHRVANQAQNQANTAVTGWIWQAEYSSRTCPACLAMSGTEHPKSEYGPNGHPNCVLPGAVVSGAKALASATRWFDGEVIDIETIGGRFLSVTPNHPILTTNGWVAAGEVGKGDYVLTGSGPDRPAAGRSPDDYQVPALIEDIAETLGGALPVRSVSMPTSPEDFHGDGGGSDVHVIRTNRLLRENVEPSTPQVGSKSKLVVGDMGLQSLAGSSGPGDRLSSPGASANGSLGREHDSSILFGGSARSEKPVRGGGISNVHTCGLKTVAYDVPGHPELVSDRLLGSPGSVESHDSRVGHFGATPSAIAHQLGSSGEGGRLVAPQATLFQDVADTPGGYPVPPGDEMEAFAGNVVADRVLNVFRRSWSGHVYNLETSVGWYVANGIITHNCRCTAMPITKSWTELGFPGIEEPPSLLQDPEDWMRANPHDALSVLGPDRYRMWMDGKIELSDMATLHRNTEWMDYYQATSLTDLRKVAKQ